MTNGRSEDETPAAAAGPAPAERPAPAPPHPDAQPTPAEASAGPAADPAFGAAAGHGQREGITRTVRLVALLVALAVAAVAVVTTLVLTGPPSRQDLLEQAGLIGKRELLVGVKDDQPGIGWQDPQTKVFSGFDIDIALMIASDLGFRPNEVKFIPIQSEDRSRMQAGGKIVDLVIASYSVTAEREASDQVTFSAPYLETEQSVLTRVDHRRVDTLFDLAGERVCTLATSTSAARASLAGATLVRKLGIGECEKELLEGRIDAITTDAAILAGLVNRNREKLRLYDVGDEASEFYGVNTGDSEALRDLVNLTLYQSLTDPDDRRWEDAFDRHLRPEQPAAGDQPVAVDQQPDVKEVEVRRWPWETLARAPRSVAATVR
ncbi:transporter substrate-binding domain-containing protein [Micromonospora sp. NPDC049559]|uniref:transporter substrate-binding domain-containing protein n=1 Tax=Micromonospora sp. NPDC049559 TaxID=3155923 RepID=UPI00341A2983